MQSRLGQSGSSTLATGVVSGDLAHFPASPYFFQPQIRTSSWDSYLSTSSSTHPPQPRKAISACGLSLKSISTLALVIIVRETINNDDDYLRGIGWRVVCGFKGKKPLAAARGHLLLFCGCLPKAEYRFRKDKLGAKRGQVRDDYPAAYRTSQPTKADNSHLDRQRRANSLKCSKLCWDISPIVEKKY